MTHVAAPMSVLIHDVSHELVLSTSKSLVEHGGVGCSTAQRRSGRPAMQEYGKHDGSVDQSDGLWAIACGLARQKRPVVQVLTPAGLDGHALGHDLKLLLVWVVRVSPVLRTDLRAERDRKCRRVVHRATDGGAIETGQPVFERARVRGAWGDPVSHELARHRRSVGRSVGAGQVTGLLGR